MARQKNPTALFDVIHSAKKPPKASPSAALPTPKWWGKGRKLPKTPVVESTENVGKQKSWLTRAKENGVNAVPASVAPVVSPLPVEDSSPVDEMTATPVEVAAAAPEISAEPKPRFIDRFVNRAPKVETAMESVATESVLSDSTDSVSTDNDAYEIEIKPDVTQSRSLREPVIRLDSVGGDIKFRLSYAAVIAVGFIFVVSLAIAFVAGRQSVSSQTAFDDDFGSGAKASPTTLPTYGMTMAVGPTTPVVSPDKVVARPDVLLPQHPTKPAVTLPLENPVHTLLPINQKTRTIGMIYVIIQSYAEKDLAQKACDFVNAQGVECTVVQGPSHWARPDWYSVVSLQPFNKHDPELPDFEKSVRALGSKFTNRIIDQFQPQGYTWRPDSDMAQE